MSFLSSFHVSKNETILRVLKILNFFLSLWFLLVFLQMNNASNVYCIITIPPLCFGLHTPPGRCGGGKDRLIAPTLVFDAWCCVWRASSEKKKKNCCFYGFENILCLVGSSARRLAFRRLQSVAATQRHIVQRCCDVTHRLRGEIREFSAALKRACQPTHHHQRQPLRSKFRF